MAATPCLIDSNILIRWVQPSDPDYPVVECALQFNHHPRLVSFEHNQIRMYAF
jgi:hypothetical protein